MCVCLWKKEKNNPENAIDKWNDILRIIWLNSSCNTSSFFSTPVGPNYFSPLKTISIYLLSFAHQLFAVYIHLISPTIVSFLSFQLTKSAHATTQRPPLYKDHASLSLEVVINEGGTVPAEICTLHTLFPDCVECPARSGQVPRMDSRPGLSPPPPPTNCPQQHAPGSPACPVWPSHHGDRGSQASPGLGAGVDVLLAAGRGGWWDTECHTCGQVWDCSLLMPNYPQVLARKL